MKSYILTLIGALMIGSANMSAQDYDDVYYNTNTKQKAKSITSKESKSSTSVASQNPYFTKYAKTALKSDTASVIVNGRDVDEYNRRYTDDAKQYYADEYSAYESDSTNSGENFKYTDRIVKFHNADVVVHSNDPELIELYYDNRPQVNLIVGTTYTSWYNDPFSWGYYDPWYSWSWGRPYRYGWYAGWYDPWYSWSWGWHGGWYDPWCSWGWGYPHYSYSHWHGWGPGFYGVRYSDGGRMTSGYRNNRNGVFSGNNMRPGYATTANTRRSGFSSGASTRNDNTASGRLNYLRRGRAGFGTNASGSNNYSRPGTAETIRRSAGSQTTDNMNERRNSFISRERQSSNYRSNDRNTFDSNRQSSSFNNSRRSGSGFSGGGFSGGGSRGGGSFGGGGRRR